MTKMLFLEESFSHRSDMRFPLSGSNKALAILCISSFLIAMASVCCFPSLSTFSCSFRGNVVQVSHVLKPDSLLTSAGCLFNQPLLHELGACNWLRDRPLQFFQLISGHWRWGASYSTIEARSSITSCRLHHRSGHRRCHTNREKEVLPNYSICSPCACQHSV